MTKEMLLATGYFLDNKYLDEYLDIVKNNSTSTEYCEWHHILPVSYFKIINKVDLKTARTKLANIEDNMVRLVYDDHIKAHILLCQCTSSKLKSASYLAVMSMLTKAKNKTAIIKQINNLQNLQIDGVWTLQEVAWLMENLPKYNSIKVCAEKLNKTYAAVQHKAKRLNIKFNRLYTQTKEVRDKAKNTRKQTYKTKWKNELPTEAWQWLNENYYKVGLKASAEYLNISYNVLSRLVGIAGLRNKRWTIEQEQWLLKNYKILPIEECIKYLNKSEGAIKLKFWNLTKDDE